MSPKSIEQALDAVADALAREKKVILSVHVKPDGDALGSLLAMHRALTQLGADSVMYLAGDEPAPPEYRFLSGLSEARRQLPDDFAQRTLVALDCGNAERLGNDGLVKAAPRIINIDHHGDNSRFGEINLVVAGASSTAELIYFLLRKLEVKITPEMAEALYAGILVDSGRFQYSAATPTTFRVAADLITRGADHTAIFRRVYENMPLAKVRLLSRMLGSLRLECDGRLAIGVLERSDFEAAGASNGLTEGLVDNLRAIEGVRVAALIYARPGNEGEGGQPHYRVSLRSSGDDVNVQRVAKRKGGGGHPQAAGFSAEEGPEELIRFLSQQVSQALERASRRAKGRAGHKTGASG